jgi:hypothetical protein
VPLAPFWLLGIMAGLLSLVGIRKLRKTWVNSFGYCDTQRLLRGPFWFRAFSGLQFIGIGEAHARPKPTSVTWPRGAERGLSNVSSWLAVSSLVFLIPDSRFKVPRAKTKVSRWDLDPIQCRSRRG